MKKIPGTLYYLGITSTRDNKLNSSALDNGRLEEIEEVGKQVRLQIRELWVE